MRLYLSSFRLGNAPEEMLDLLGDKRRTAVVLNADDYKDAAARAASLEREFGDLMTLGLEPFELDLRTYFGRSGDLAAVLSSVDLVYVRGGSAFVLRRAFAHSGADRILTDLLTTDAIVYAGYSAGPAMLTPSLHGIDGKVDVPDFIPAGYPPCETIWNCLGLLPYHLAPHYRSDHPESPEIEETVQYFIDNHLTFIALRDGEALVVDGDTTRVVGLDRDV